MRYQMVVALAVSVGALAAQQLKFSASFERLSAKASETVSISLDPQTLGFAAKFLSSDGDEGKARKVVSKLTGIQVRSFEFDQDNAYSDADVNELRNQMKGPEWSLVVSTRSKKGRELSEIYLHREGGLVIIAAEARELTVVNILGRIDPSDLNSLGGQFGIPRNMVPNDSTPKPARSRDKDKDKDKDKDRDEVE